MIIKSPSYTGPAIDDPEILQHLPAPLTELLHQINGFIIHRGALHVRGASHHPKWHSIRNIFIGDLALHRLYSEVMDTDVPFGQDCVGDQFLLRNNLVFRLDAEIGTIENLEITFEEFIISA